MLARTILVIYLLVFVGNCDFTNLSPCAEEFQSYAYSPDGRYTAAVYERNCGATTDYSTVVRLSEADSNVANGDVIFLISGSKEVVAEWKNVSVLELGCSDCRQNDIFVQEAAWKSVMITTKPLP